MNLQKTSIIYASSQLISTGISFIATIYLARLLGASGYGTYTLIISVVSWLKLGGHLGLSTAMTKRISEGDSSEEFRTAGIISIAIFYSFTCVLIILFSSTITSYFGEELIEILLVILLVELGLSIVSATLKGEDKVHIYSILTTLKVGSRSITQVGLLFLGFGLIGALAGYVIGTIIIIILSLLFISTGLSKPKREHFRSLYSFGKYSWLGSMEKRTFSNIDFLLIGYFLTSFSVGIYTVAWVISSSLMVFSKGLSMTIFPKISQVTSGNQQPKIEELVSTATTYNGIILIPGVIGAYLAGDTVLELYGEEYIKAHYLLVGFIFIKLIYSYKKLFSSILNGMDKPEKAFRVNVVLVTTNVLLNILLIPSFGLIGALAGTGISALCCALYSYYILLHEINIKMNVKEIMYQLAAGLMMAMYIILIQKSGILNNQHLMAGLLVEIGVAVVVYGAFLILLSKEVRRKFIAIV